MRWWCVKYSLTEFFFSWQYSQCHSRQTNATPKLIHASSALSKSPLKSTHGAHRQHKSVLFGFIEQLNKRWRYHDVMRRFTRELIFRTRYHPSEDYIMFEPILNKSIFLFGILSLHVLTTFYPIPWPSSIQRMMQ